MDKHETVFEIIIPKDLRQGIINNSKEGYSFKFGKVFDQEASQEQVFNEVAAPVVESCIDGYNGTIFAYG